MLDKIEALRKKPEAVRNRYAFITALSSTLVIAIIWAISLPSRLTLEESVSEDADQDAPTLTEQLSKIRDVFGEGVEEIKAQAELVGIESSTSSENGFEVSDALLERQAETVKASSTASTSVEQ